ncbi:MAG: ABC transporter ATP-binding protein [Coriobacteriia bacterium]|nr:ABC transporter ATP-binding protein [Coriobacteriia bacterium]
MQNIIKIKNLKKSFGEGGSYNLVLKGITVQIKEGDICCILGPSGCGKSTFLNMLGGLDSPDSGNVYIEDTDISKLTLSELADYRRDKIGFVFQFYNLIPDLNIKENVQVCENLTQSPLDRKDLFDVLGLAKLEYRFPNELSGGQQQRTAIARALVKNPRILLCDEPTGALDSKTSKEILKLLCNVNKKYGTTIVIVTHNAKIAHICNQMIKMKDGNIQNVTFNDNVLDVDCIEF